MGLQLDIFDDSHDVRLRNDLALAVQTLDAAAAVQALAALQAAFPRDAMLAPGALLTAHLQAAPAPDAATVLQVRAALQGPLAPAAQRLLGTAATPWLQRQWQTLAERARSLAIGWQPALADAHPAGLHLLGADWAAAAQAVGTIEAWRRIPQPLLWMAEARWRLHGPDAGWPLLAEGLWLAPQRAAALLQRLPDRNLPPLIDRFEAVFESQAQDDGAHWAWLPAFALVERPLLAQPLAVAEARPDRAAAQAFSLVAALLRLERQGRHPEIVAQRARLRALSAPLFAAYMATR